MQEIIPLKKRNPFSKHIPSWLPKTLKSLLLVGLLVTALLYRDFFIADSRSTVDFIPTNYSNPILASSPVRIRFTASHFGLRTVSLRFIPHSEAAADTTLTFTLSDEKGVVLQRTVLPAEEVAACPENISLTMEAKPVRGRTYTLLIESDALSDTAAYRLSMGTAAHTDVQEWSWGGQIEVDFPDVQFLYRVISPFYTLLFTACVVGALLAIFLPGLRSEKWKLLYHLGVLLAAPLLLLYATELLNMGTVLKLPLGALLANYLILLLVLMLLYALTNRFSLAVILGGALILVGAAANHFTLRFRQSTVLPADLYGLRTAVEVMPGYQFSLSPGLLIACAIFVLLLCLSLRDRVVLRGWKHRAASSLLTVFLGIGMWGLISTPSLYQRLGATLDNFRQTPQCKINGFYLNFSMNLPFLFSKPPRGYDFKSLDSFLPVAEPEEVPPVPSPHLIVVMNESLADLSIAGGIGADEDPLPFLHSLAGDDDPSTYVGNLTVPVYGGGTSCTEFEFLTGYSLAFCNSSGAPYGQYLNHEVPALPRQLGNLGYYRVGLHPGQGYNWNRNTAYPRLGFDETWFLEDGFSSVGSNRGFVSDTATYEKVLELFEEHKEDGPVFLFAVTIQNHGGYDNPYFENTVTVQRNGKEFPLAEQYFSLLKLSDSALNELMKTLSQEEDPVLLVMFGDHWGALGDDYLEMLFGKPLDQLSGEEELLRYQTPVVVWSNYGLDLSGLPDLLSSNYLAAVIKQAAGLSLTPFERFALSAREGWPVISSHGAIDAQGSFIQRMPENDPILTGYSYLQYNALSDRKHLQESLFLPALPEEQPKP